jgi:hypothetical protein
MQHVIKARPGAKLFTKPIESRRTKDIHMRGQSLFADHFNQRPSDGAVTPRRRKSPI